MCLAVLFFFQAEDGIRDLVRSRGLGDVYKRQALPRRPQPRRGPAVAWGEGRAAIEVDDHPSITSPCLLYTSDAADERSSVDLGGRRIIKKKNKVNTCDRRSIIQNIPQIHEGVKHT